jgi:hypothetical protein
MEMKELVPIDPISDSEWPRMPIKRVPKRLYPKAWPLRDAMACMCIRDSEEKNAECDIILCDFSNVGVFSDRRTNAYVCRRGRNHRLMVSDIHPQVLAAEKRAAKFSSRPVRSALDLLVCVKNTIELEKMQVDGVTAHATQIDFCNMSTERYSIVEFSQAWIHTKGEAILRTLRDGIPLYHFFRLFGQTLASFDEVLRCSQVYPIPWLIPYMKAIPPSGMRSTLFYRFKSDAHKTRQNVSERNYLWFLIPEIIFQEVRAQKNRLFPIPEVCNSSNVTIEPVN